MNVYLLFALAFGAISGVADVVVPRTAAVAAIRVRAAKQISVAGTPLTGATSPRAPAVNC